MSDTTLGELAPTLLERDAIHVAVIALEAGQLLRPGEHVCIKDNQVFANQSTNSIGIVDPFLTEVIEKDKIVWVLLYPNTITSMRHHWEHPVVDLITKKVEVTSQYANQTLCRIADLIGISVEELLEAGRDYARRGEYTFENSENYKNLSPSDWLEFWNAFSAITGTTIPEDERYTTPFTCSC